MKNDMVTEVPKEGGNPGSGTKGVRLIEIDSLRGIAAVMVMMFHYTTRYDHVFQHTSSPLFYAPWGWRGVNLFFMISGFVIFMTLDRTRHPLDFVVSRFSRLYPTYWVAAAVTFALVALLNVPGKSVGTFTALGNALMFHGLFGIQDIDGIYWTLEIELLFYTWMLALWAAGWLKRPYLFIALWLGLRLLYAGCQWIAGVNLPYVGFHFLILGQIPYFVIGIIIYLHVTNPSVRPWQGGLSIIASLALIAATESVVQMLLSVVFAGLLYGAASSTLGLLRIRLLVWLGAISYPLYLLHENIGWGILLHLENSGWNPNLAIVLTMAAVLILAALLHYSVEQPAMSIIRSRYRSFRDARKESALTFVGRRWVVGIAVGLFATAVASVTINWKYHAHASDLPGADQIFQIQTTHGPDLSCLDSGSSAPLVLVVLGQSNAGNHGEAGQAPESHAIPVFFRGRCYLMGDPLPGGTGRGRSIWTELAGMIERDDGSRRVIIAPLAVASTSIVTWTEAGPVRDALDRLVADLREARLTPTAILWQQGETDADIGTMARDYRQRFATLVMRLRAQGIAAPVFVARSSYCHGDGYGYIGRVQTALPGSIPGVEAGADTDAIPGGGRYDDCHFSHVGLQEAAQRWYYVLREKLFRPETGISKDAVVPH